MSCLHRLCFPEHGFDENMARQAHSILTRETAHFLIREEFPRFDGVCPDCRQHVILYESDAHKVFGGW